MGIFVLAATAFSFFFFFFFFSSTMSFLSSGQGFFSFSSFSLPFFSFLVYYHSFSFVSLYLCIFFFSPCIGSGRGFITSLVS